MLIQNTTKLLGLMISNGLIAMSGALVTQSQGYADIKMGIGAIVIGLASIVIGVILGRKPGFMFTLTAIIVGSIFVSYYCCSCFTIGSKY